MGGTLAPPGSAQFSGSIGGGQICTSLSNHRERNRVSEICLIIPTLSRSASMWGGQVSAPPGFRLRTVVT